MTRYQINVLDKDITDLVHEIPTQIISQVIPYCDLEAQPTELQNPDMPKHDFGGIDSRSARIKRYVPFIDVTLKEFAKELEVEVLKNAAKKSKVKNWHGLLFPVIRKNVEAISGKYTYYFPTCNRGEYICEVGACTEFDPWERVTPKSKVKSK